jgi:hypothetical protein
MTGAYFKSRAVPLCIAYMHMAPDFGADADVWRRHALVVMANRKVARLLLEEGYEYTKRPSLF